MGIEVISMLYDFNDVIYETWVCDECGETVLKCSEYSESEIDDYLSEHPEYSIRTLPIYL